jgi:hypothetical protein
LSKSTQDLLDQSLCYRLIVIRIIDDVNELLNKTAACAPKSFRAVVLAEVSPKFHPLGV